MPDKPLWLQRLPEAIHQLESSEDPWVDRARLESLLGVGRRRAQQLLAPVATRVVGSSRVARASAVIACLKQAASGDEAGYDTQRRRRLWTKLGEPPVLVEVPSTTIQRIVRNDFHGLPEGVDLAPGSIALRFTSSGEALEKLVALALAISHNREAFDALVNPPT